MTTKPELKLGRHLFPAVAAVALFAVMAVVFLTAPFDSPSGFPEGAAITASIGYAMFNVAIGGIEGTLVSGEGFLVAFEIIDLVLVAALAAAVLLARREQGGRTVSALLTDGGPEADESDAGTAVDADTESATDTTETGGDA